MVPGRYVIPGWAIGGSTKYFCRVSSSIISEAASENGFGSYIAAVMSAGRALAGMGGLVPRNVPEGGALSVATIRTATTNRFKELRSMRNSWKRTPGHLVSTSGKRSDWLPGADCACIPPTKHVQAIKAKANPTRFLVLVLDLLADSKDEENFLQCHFDLTWQLCSVAIAF